MDTNALKYLLDLAECKNFSKAAEMNFISQSSFSRAILRLESELDVKLIDRDRHPIALTPAGECFCRDFSMIALFSRELLTILPSLSP